MRVYVCVCVYLLILCIDYSYLPKTNRRHEVLPYQQMIYRMRIIRGKKQGTSSSIQANVPKEIKTASAKPMNHLKVHLTFIFMLYSAFLRTITIRSDLIRLIYRILSGRLTQPFIFFHSPLYSIMHPAFLYFNNINESSHHRNPGAVQRELRLDNFSPPRGS